MYSAYATFTTFQISGGCETRNRSYVHLTKPVSIQYKATVDGGKQLANNVFSRALNISRCSFASISNIAFQDPSDPLNNLTTSLNASIARSTPAIPVPTSSSTISSSRETASGNKEADTADYIVIGNTVPILVIAFLVAGVFIAWRRKNGIKQASTAASSSHA